MCSSFAWTDSETTSLFLYKAAHLMLRQFCLLEKHLLHWTSLFTFLWFQVPALNIAVWHNTWFSPNSSSSAWKISLSLGKICSLASFPTSKQDAGQLSFKATHSEMNHDTLYKKNLHGDDFTLCCYVRCGRWKAGAVGDKGRLSIVRGYRKVKVCWCTAR